MALPVSKPHPSVAGSFKAMIKNTIKSLRIENLLSFGPKSPPVELGDLNVLIGPNGSGKSNFIEVLGLLHSTPKDLEAEIGAGGGISDLLWKGWKGKVGPVALIEAVANPAGINQTLRYSLSFTKVGASIKIREERIENAKHIPAYDKPYLYYDYGGGKPVLNVAEKQRHLRREEVNTQQSILSQRQDPDQYPEVTYLGRFFSNFRLYRDWGFGPGSEIRDLYGAELKTDFLEEDISNLGLMLHRMRGELKSDFLRYLRMFYAGADDIYAKIVGGLVDLRVEEAGDISIPASRLSDGTLRWLSLLAILLNPDPPPVVCIEEPELGLHPDIIRPLAELLVKASERMQLFVTTHSDSLVDELSEIPNSVIVCEKNEGTTVMRRVDKTEIKGYLERYTLGQLWRTGKLGGNRW